MTTSLDGVVPADVPGELRLVERRVTTSGATLVTYARPD